MKRGWAQDGLEFAFELPSKRCRPAGAAGQATLQPFWATTTAQPSTGAQVCLQQAPTGRQEEQPLAPAASQPSLVSVSFRLAARSAEGGHGDDEDTQDTADSSSSASSGGGGGAITATTTAGAAAEEGSITSGEPLRSSSSSRAPSFSFGCRPSTAPDLATVQQWDLVKMLLTLSQHGP